MIDLLIFLAIGGLITSALAIRLNRYFKARRQWWQVLLDMPPEKQEQYVKDAYATLAIYRRDMWQQMGVPEKYLRVPLLKEGQLRLEPYSDEFLDEFSRAAPHRYRLCVPLPDDANGKVMP